MANTVVQVRVDKTLKRQASKVLSSMGLSVSDAVRLFLTRVASEKQLPFASKTPNAKTLQAMAEAEAITLSRRVRG